MSKIEWTDETWNPVRGCSIVSEGCRHCYAMQQAHRFSGEGQAYEGLTRLTPTGPKWTGKIRLVPERLEDPLHWKKPRQVFVNSMSDLFHPDVPFGFIASVFTTMAATERHTYQILTKRPKRMLEWFRWIEGDGSSGESPAEVWPLSNVWLGVSVEDQITADERIPPLLDVPAAVRFLSCEPLLGPLRFPLPCVGSVFWSGLHWIIVGGESGPGARMCNVDWVLDILRQGERAGCPVFIKQLGADCGYSGNRFEWFKGAANTSADEVGYPGVRRLRDRKGGDMSEWPEELRVREFPAVERLTCLEECE